MSSIFQMKAFLRENPSVLQAAITAVKLDDAWTSCPATVFRQFLWYLEIQWVPVSRRSEAPLRCRRMMMMGMRTMKSWLLLSRSRVLWVPGDLPLAYATLAHCRHCQCGPFSATGRACH